MRGLMALELARQLKVPLSDAEQQLLKELETANLAAFQDNYTGKIFELRSQSARDQEELNRLRNLAMHYYAKAILEDTQYMAVRNNYRGTFDFQKFVSTREEKKERVQGRLNELAIFGLKQDEDAKRNINDWIARNAIIVSAMVNGLADEYVLEVQGHCDVMGYPQQLQELSEARARTVSERLRAAGVFSDKIRFRGYGATRLIPWIEPGHESNNR